jgi:hypothetical protein
MSQTLFLYGPYPQTTSIVNDGAVSSYDETLKMINSDSRLVLLTSNMLNTLTSDEVITLCGFVNDVNNTKKQKMTIVTIEHPNTLFKDDVDGGEKWRAFVERQNVMLRDKNRPITINSITGNFKEGFEVMEFVL